MPRVNLLPFWLKRQRVVDWRAVVAVVTLVAVAAFAAFNYYLMFQRVQLLRQELERVKHEQTLLGPLLNRLTQLEQEKQAILDKRQFLEGVRARRWAPVLSEIAGLTPVNVQLKLLELVDPRSILIVGHAGNLEAIAQLMSGIDRSSLLERAGVRYARDADGLYEFEVRCAIR